MAFYRYLVMAQLNVLIAALKKQLKASGMTYADIGCALELSEASIKRMFAQGHFTLARMESILQLIGLEFTDLLDLVQRESHQIEQLNLEQEAQIAADLELLVIAVSVIHGFSYDELKTYYNLSEHQLIQKLAALDRLKLIDLLPGNRIKLKIAPNFRWQSNGPIQQFFLQKVQRDFFNSNFDQTTDKLLVLNGLCSSATNQEIQDKMQEFVNKISELNKADGKLPLGEKNGTTLVVALRQWQYETFSGFVREEFRK